MAKKDKSKRYKNGDYTYDFTPLTKKEIDKIKEFNSDVHIKSYRKDVIVNIHA